MDIRQSLQYANFMTSLGWQVEKTEKSNAFVKKFPLIGSLIKIQRISCLPNIKEINTLAKKHKAFKILIEFDQINKEGKIPLGFNIYPSPFLPTKTIHVDLNRSEKEIFNSFSSAKRRVIRKAEKNQIVIEKGTAIDFIFLKRKSLAEKLILPVGEKKDVLALEKAFSPDDIVFLIAGKNKKPLAGILLLFFDKTAYYWQAASTNKGKNLAAPSLLVWEALKLSKRKKCKVFDFEGIYDERFPINSWKGFTKFKQGFGGKEVLYSKPITNSRHRRAIYSHKNHNIYRE
jgi:hypothetical protein